MENLPLGEEAPPFADVEDDWAEDWCELQGLLLHDA